MFLFETVFLGYPLHCTCHAMARVSAIFCLLSLLLTYVSSSRKSMIVIYSYNSNNVVRM